MVVFVHWQVLLKRCDKFSCNYMKIYHNVWVRVVLGNNFLDFGVLLIRIQKFYHFWLLHTMEASCASCGAIYSLPDFTDCNYRQ